MDCEGTEGCPPRCPRFVGSDGTIYTIRPLEDIERTVPSERVSADADFALIVENAGTAVAWAAHDPGGPATIELADGADPGVGTELGRQLVTRRRTDGFDELTLLAPPDVLSPLEAELGPAAVSLDEGDVLAVDLTGDSVDRLSLAPARRADLSDPEDFSSLLEPESVAVVGATDREGAIGRVVVENLQASFDGEVIPITDRHESVCGLDTIPSIGDLAADTVDLAVIALPADLAIDAVRDAVDAEIDAVVVLASGFNGGDAVEERRANELREVLDGEDVTLLGPNALGVLSTRSGLNASFAPRTPTDGGVSVLSHSGALITATLEWAHQARVGVRDAVSIGNGFGVDEGELIRHWGSDPDTSVIVAYFEDADGGRPFVEAVRAVTPTTPVVALKSGRSDEGAAAAASHTGALVGDDSGFDAAFEAAGVIRARSQEELYDLALAFDRQPMPSGERVAIITNAGGPGVLAADAIADSACALASLSEETRSRLDEFLPDAASIENPVDILGDADVERFIRSLEIVLADPGVDAVMVVSTPHPLVSLTEVVDGVGEAVDRYGTPVVTCFSGGAPDETLRDALAEASVPNYTDAERAASVLEAMARYDRIRNRPDDDPMPVEADRVWAGSIVRDAVGDSTLGVESMELLEAYDVETPEVTLSSSAAGAAEAAERFTRNAALKVASPTLAHKTDIGGVAVDVPPGDVTDAYEELIETVERNAPSADVRGVYVQEMAPDGVECLIGVTRHPRFGPLVTFGLGGVLVEELDAVVHGLAPLSRADAVDLVESLDAEEILNGVRGQDPIDRDALIDALVRLSWIPIEFPAIDELEVNPLIATPDGAYAVDLHGALSSKRGD